MHRGILLSFYSSAAAFVNGKCACFLPGFLGRAQKARAGQDDLECAPRALCAYSAEKFFFNSAMPERLRTLRHCIFTGEGAAGQLHL